MNPFVFLPELLLLLSAFLPFSLSSSGPHIADLTVLLPPRMTNPVEYRLQGSDGCFSWSWDHHEILFVQPEYNGTGRCSTSARLVSIAPYSGRKETAVYASDLQSGTVIRCEVFIEKISKVRIFHHSVKLDLDGLATLQVLAFDEEDNVFSSLVGLKFRWQFSSTFSEDNKTQHHLVHVPLKKTPLSDCGGFCGDLITRTKLEDSGIGSDLYVVRGIKIGQEIVSVHLLEPHLEHVADKIILTVAEAMSLDPPSPIFVIVGAVIQYSVRVIRQNTPQEIALPSPYHRWFVTNSSVAKVDRKLGLTEPLDFGVTSVIVEDTRISGHVQISTLHVVVPDALCLFLVPVTNSSEPIHETSTTSKNIWYVVIGMQYVVHLKVFSPGPDPHEMHIAKNNDVRLLYNHYALWDTFMVLEEASIRHGWRNPVFLKPTAEGLGSLTAELLYRNGNKETLGVLKVSQQVMVCKPLRISRGNGYAFSSTIHLPWAPMVYQELELTATGGCAKTVKDYNWFSSNLAVVSVSPIGVVRANIPGKATIKVVSIFDSMNYAEVIVEVSVPSSMVMLQHFLVEAVVGTYLPAAVTMKTAQGFYFHSCDAFRSYVRWQMLGDSESFRIANRTGELLEFTKVENKVGLAAVAPACSWTYLYASSAGRVTLHATLAKDVQTSDQLFGGPIILKASCLIAAYTPLLVQQAGHGNKFGGYWIDLEQVPANVDELYLVTGTELDVVLFGGPEPWDQEVQFVENVKVFSEDYRPLEDGLLAKPVSFGERRLFRISCRVMGNFKLLFSRGNLVGDGHAQPAVANVEVSLFCGLPSLISIIANEPVNRPELIHSAIQADRGPGKIRVSPIGVANNCTIRVAAAGVHDSGRAFANSSSLCLVWELSGCEHLAYWKNLDNYEESECSWERFLVLENTTGLCTVRAAISGLSDATSVRLLEEVSLMVKNLKKDLTDGVRLQLVSSLRIVPQSILLFFHPDGKAALSIIGGTCFLEAAANDTLVVDIIQPPDSSQCSSLIASPRGIGGALITVRDVGLTPAIAASVEVQVADVDWIRIICQDEISLTEGTVQPFDIVAGINDGGVFDPSQYVYMNIRLHIDDGVLELVDEGGFSSQDRRLIQGSKFFLRTAQLGITMLHVSARRQSGQEIFSQFIKVEVYAPLQILPEDLFLSPGASYVLTVRGGPMNGVVVKYATLDDRIATVDESMGKLSAVSLGNTSILATAYGRDGAEICEAYGRLRVGIPSQMVLNLQSDHLSVGRDMKIFVSSVEGNLFSFYELCQNYQWEIDNEQVLSFQTVHPPSLLLTGLKERKFLDYSGNDDIGFVNVVLGRSAGKSRISVSFSCDFVSVSSQYSRSYNASGLLLVIPNPPLSLGMPITWILPPFYTTSDLLPQPLESYGQLDGRRRKGTISYSLLRSCGKTDNISIEGARIKTKESGDMACIHAKDLSTGKAEVASCVRVAEVAVVRVNVKDSPLHMAEVASGDELELLLSLHDSLGNPFHEAYGVAELDIVTNYPDVASIRLQRDENITGDGIVKAYVQANHHGRALIQVSMDGNSRKTDYILISVGMRLHPQNPVLNVGHHINFSVTGGGKIDLEPGRWFSVNESVITVDTLSGEAYAVDEGSSEVLFEGSALKLRTKVTVLRVASISVDAPRETLTNVPFPSKGYKFSVTFSDFYREGFEAYDRGHLGYDCKVEPSFVGYAKPWRDLDTGKRYCLFFPYTPEYLVNSIPKLQSSRQELASTLGGGLLDLSIVASMREAQQVEGSTHALFTGGFSLLVKNKLNLTRNSYRSTITLIGNTDVVFYWNARERLFINLLKRDDSGIGGRAEYEVRASEGETFTDKIVIVLPATGQKTEIDVSYEDSERTSSMNTGFVWIMIVGILFPLLMAIICVRCLRDRPSTNEQVAPAVRPATTSLATPDRSPPGQLSPQTPQPHLEYIRRSIDETPYYRRNGRRRFDPQNTY